MPFEKQVKDVMQTEVETIKPTADCEEILHRLVNQPFLVVVDDDNHFWVLLPEENY